jgi:type VI secretion system protein ImpL
MSAQMLGQFEAAQRIRRLFFQSGASAKLEFTLAVPELEAGTSKFKLEIDGKLHEFSRGPSKSYNVVWPGDGPGRVAMRFEGGRGTVNSAQAGPWALFHFMDASMAQAESDVRTVLRAAASGYTVRVRIDAGSVDNPFTNRSWRQFRCGF